MQYHRGGHFSRRVFVTVCLQNLHVRQKQAKRDSLRVTTTNVVSAPLGIRLIILRKPIHRFGFLVLLREVVSCSALHPLQELRL